MSGRVRRQGDRHGWNTLDNYLKVHDRRLADLKPEFILADNLTYQRVSPETFRIAGRIYCRHGLFLDVVKLLEINSRNRARTMSCTDHAGVLGAENRPIFRYDNAHGYPGHDDAHHKHCYVHQPGPDLWTRIEPPIWVGYADWPHLDEALRELRDWWDTSGQFLNIVIAPDDLPDCCRDEGD